MFELAIVLLDDVSWALANNFVSPRFLPSCLEVFLFHSFLFFCFFKEMQSCHNLLEARDILQFFPFLVNGIELPMQSCHNLVEARDILQFFQFLVNGIELSLGVWQAGVIELKRTSSSQKSFYEKKCGSFALFSEMVRIIVIHLSFKQFNILKNTFLKQICKDVAMK